MNDKGQLDFDGLLGGKPEPKKPTRKRRPAKAPVEAPAEEGAFEAPTQPESVPDPAARALPDAEPTPEPTPEPQPEPDLVASADEPAPVTTAPESDPPTPAELGPEVSTEAGDEASPDVQEAPADPNPPRLFFLTNRMNLNGVLSSRVLAPRESFHKYYADLLEAAPGWVPILTVPPPASLVERVVAERGAGAPVLVELCTSALDGQSAEGPVVYVRAARMTDVRAIHFRDKKSLREHRARVYSNVHPHDDLLQVSPELFAAPSGAEIRMTPPSEATATSWLHLDRVRGAASAALAASDSGEALAVAAGLLGAGSLPADTILPPWLTWTGLTGAVVTSGPETDAELADRLIFQTAYRVLGEQDQAEAWSPSGVLEEVAAGIAAATPSDEAQAIADRNLQRVRELVNIERDFEPFRNPGSPYVAAKSLLMVLLRPDLDQLLGWPTKETGADETTRVVAAILAGRLRGIARESVTLRSLPFDDLSAAWAVRAAKRDESSLGVPEFLADEQRTALLLDALAVRETAALIPDPVAIYEALPSAARQPARLALSRQLAWPVKVDVHIPVGANVQTGESVITITSSEYVSVESFVDEQAFVDRLRQTSGEAKRRLVDAFERTDVEPRGLPAERS